MQQVRRGAYEIAEHDDMRCTWWLAVGLAARTARAEPTFDECMRLRRDQYAYAVAQSDLHERARLLRALPQCKRSVVVAPAAAIVQGGPPGMTAPIAVVDVVETTPVHAKEYVTNTVMIAPATTLLAALLGSFGVELRGELAVRPHFAVGVSTTYVAIDILRAVQLGFTNAEVVWFADRFSGGHVSAGLVGGGWHADAQPGDGFFDPEPEDGGSFVGASLTGGWKGIRPNGETWSARFGFMLVGTDDGDLHVVPYGGLYIGWSGGGTDARRRLVERARAAERAERARREHAWTLTKHAGSAARDDDCANAHALATQVRTLDREFYATVTARDVAIARCLASAPVAP
jgi:hypothetical protein